MEERLMIYVYCGKLVKLMKEYKEEFIYDFDYNKFSFTLEFPMISEDGDFCISKKEEIVPRMVEAIEAYIESYRDEVNEDKLNELIQKIKKNKEEIVLTTKKIKWDHSVQRDDMDKLEFLEQFFGLDSLREDAVEEFDQFNCVDDVSDDDIIECYPFFSFVEIYTYDSRKNQDDRYKLIY